MKGIIFVTGNDRKGGKPNYLAVFFDIEALNQLVDIVETQSSDAMKLLEHKTRTSYEVLNKPIVVTDTLRSIPALSGFQGAYMKEVDRIMTAKSTSKAVGSYEAFGDTSSENIRVTPR